MNLKIHSTKALKLEDIHLVWLTQTAEASYYLFAELWEIIFAWALWIMSPVIYIEIASGRDFVAARTDIVNNYSNEKNQINVNMWMENGELILWRAIFSIELHLHQA